MLLKISYTVFGTQMPRCCLVKRFKRFYILPTAFNSTSNEAIKKTFINYCSYKIVVSVACFLSFFISNNNSNSSNICIYVHLQFYPFSYLLTRTHVHIIQYNKCVILTINLYLFIVIIHICNKRIICEFTIRILYRKVLLNNGGKIKKKLFLRNMCN